MELPEHAREVVRPRRRHSHARIGALLTPLT
jgi:hypothetical protein